MATNFKRYLLLALLLIVPIQGMTAVVASLICGGHGETETIVAHSDASHDHAMAHEHSGDMGSGAGEHSGHSCCHHLSSVAPAAMDSVAPNDLPVFISSLALLTTLFIPEQPQRPPRS